MEFARTNGYPLGNLGASTVGNTRSGVQAVVDCDTALMSTSTNDLSAGEYRSWVLTHPYSTLDIATAEYVVIKPNHLADSGTFQTVKMIKPMLFQT
jgi:hypothetical protein